MHKGSWIAPLVGCLLSSLAAGQDFSDAELRSITEARYIDQRIMELEARLKAFEDAAAQTTTTSLEPTSVLPELPAVPDLTYQDTLQPIAHDPSPCVNVCSPSDLWLRPNPGFYGDVEILLLKWYDTDGDDGSNTTSDASRYTLGFMNDHGRSIRARYFEFGLADDLGNGQLLVQHADLEYAGRFSLNDNWLGEISWVVAGPLFPIPRRDRLRIPTARSLEWNCEANCGTG